MIRVGSRAVQGSTPAAMDKGEAFMEVFMTMTRRLILFLALLLMSAPVLAAQSPIEQAAARTIEPLIHILTRWIFPAVAFAAALYGIARGIKRGEWDFAVICLLASVVLALLPSILSDLFWKQG